MWYAMAYFPDLNHKGVNRFRETYDPTCQLIREHLPVLMPVPDTVVKKEIISHISPILSHRTPFVIHLQGLFKSWDHWLLLGVKEGYDQIVRLHDEIYSGPLKPYLREDLPFSPHVGLGLFAAGEYDFANPEKNQLDNKKYGKAFQEAVAMNLDFWCTVNSFDFIKFNDSFTRFKEEKKFILTHK